MPASASTTIVIDRAVPTASINPVAATTYNGLSHGTTGRVVGVNGIVLTSAITYTGAQNGPPVHAGTYTATVSYPGDNNYASASASTTIVINKADAMIDIVGYRVQYDGRAHQLIGTATGVLGGGPEQPVGPGHRRDRRRPVLELLDLQRH